MHISLDSALGRQRRLNSVGESVLQIAPSAAAAYSLRSLTGGDPKVVRVRRGSDNHEQDFTASEISSGALTSFVNAQVVAPLDIQALEADGRTGDFLIAKAAYSLRSLGTRQATNLAATGDTVARANGQFVCQVRRSSDDAVKSFTADEVTDGTLLAFTNENIQLFSNDFETNTDGFTLNTGGSNTAVHNTSDGFSGSGCLQLNLTSSSNSISTVKTDTYMQDTNGVTYTVSFYAKAVSGSTNLVVKIGTESSSVQQISFSENGGEWVKYSLTFVNNFGAGAGNRNQRILFAGSTSDTTEWRIDDFQIVQTTSNGFVKTWYDQSVTNEAGDTATGNHAVQATAANQPKIVNAGSLLNELDFDGTDDTLNIDFGADLSQANTLFMVHQSDSISSSANEFFDRSSGSGDRTLLDQSGSDYRMLSASSAGTGLAITTDRTLVFALYNGSSSLLAKNGTASSAVNPRTQGINQNSTLGASGARFYDGSMQEVIIYNSDQSSNRVAIEANIGEAYSIDLPSGVDPGFDQVDGFVETWYDQSGNSNDGTQATASLQPKIVDAGSLITMNGKPAFQFTSGSSSPNFHLFNMTSEISGISDFSTFFVSEVKDLSGRGVIIAKDGANYLRMRDADFQFEASNTDSGAITFNSTLTDGGQFSLAFIRASNTFTAYVAGAAQSNTVSISDNFAVDRLFGTNQNSRTWLNKAQELIFYTSDQTANVSTLNTNMASHYEIS